jgi:hypothetical protein
MQIDGYRPHGKRDNTDAFHLLLSEEVIAFLGAESGGGNRQHVKKVGHTLELIKRNGLQGVQNNTLFVYEGKFSSGKPGTADLSVYAVKAHQVRVYGGLIRVRGESVFLCPEATIKKRDKANQEQLERVARTLGSYYER